MVQKSWVNQPAMVKAAPVCDIIVDTFIHVCKQVRGTKADRKLLVHTRDCKGWTERERERGEREGGKDRHGGTDTPHVHRGSFKHAAFRVGTSDVSICRKSSMLA